MADLNEKKESQLKKIISHRVEEIKREPVEAFRETIVHQWPMLNIKKLDSPAIHKDGFGPSRSSIAGEMELHSRLYIRYDASIDKFNLLTSLQWSDPQLYYTENALSKHWHIKHPSYQNVSLEAALKAGRELQSHRALIHEKEWNALNKLTGRYITESAKLILRLRDELTNNLHDPLKFERLMKPFVSSLNQMME